MRIERYGNTRYWAVRDRDGALICLCVSEGSTGSATTITNHGEGESIGENARDSTYPWLCQHLRKIVKIATDRCTIFPDCVTTPEMAVLKSGCVLPICYP